jgi:hypothetical protein
LISQGYLNAIARQLNNRPRRCLDDEIPLEVFLREIISNSAGGVALQADLPGSAPDRGKMSAATEGVAGCQITTGDTIRRAVHARKLISVTGSHTEFRTGPFSVKFLRFARPIIPD